jgi:hypothetical protein
MATVPREPTMEQALAELEAGNTQKAKDRLQGLLSSYPDDLEVRLALAHAYRCLGDAVQAGRWGYLRLPMSPVETTERMAFELRNVGKCSGASSSPS